MRMAYDIRESSNLDQMWRLETMSKTSLSFIVSSGTQKAIMREKIIKRLNAEFLRKIPYSVFFFWREQRGAAQLERERKMFFALALSICTPRSSSSFWYDEYFNCDFHFIHEYLSLLVRVMEALQHTIYHFGF